MKKSILALVLVAISGQVMAVDIESAAEQCAYDSVTVVMKGVESDGKGPLPAGAREKLKPFHDDFKQLCNMVYAQGVQSRTIKNFQPTRGEIFKSLKASIAANKGPKGQDMPEQVSNDLAEVYTNVYFNGYNAQ